MEPLQLLKDKNLAQAISGVQQNRGRVHSLPYLVAITALTRCNLNCLMCDQDHASSEELSLSVINKLSKIMPYVRLLNITGGEPFLYNHIDLFFELCNRFQCASMVQTNGLLLNKDRARYLLDRNVKTIKVSCDGATKGTYEHIRRGGSFKKLIQNLSYLQKLKAERESLFPVLQFNFVAMASNIRELPMLVTMASQLGVEEINVFQLRVHKEPLISESLYFYQNEANTYFREAKKMAKQKGVSLSLPPLFKRGPVHKDTVQYDCSAPWGDLTVNVNGTAAICCGGAGAAGNLNELSLDEVWNHKRRIRIRETVNTPNQLDVCNNCRMGKINPDSVYSHIPNRKLAEQALDLFSHSVDNPLPAPIPEKTTVQMAS